MTECGLCQKSRNLRIHSFSKAEAIGGRYCANYTGLWRVSAADRTQEICPPIDWSTIYSSILRKRGVQLSQGCNHAISSACAREVVGEGVAISHCPHSPGCACAHRLGYPYRRGRQSRTLLEGGGGGEDGGGVRRTHARRQASSRQSSELSFFACRGSQSMRQWSPDLTTELLSPEV